MLGCDLFTPSCSNIQKMVSTTLPWTANIFLSLSATGWVLFKISIFYQLQHAQTHFSLPSETASFRLLSRVMKNSRPCPQLILPTKLQIFRQRETMIWLIPPPCLATVKVTMSRKTKILFRVLWNRWARWNELGLSSKPPEMVIVGPSETSQWQFLTTIWSRLTQCSESDTFLQLNPCKMGAWFELYVFKSYAITLVMACKSVRHKRQDHLYWFSNKLCHCVVLFQ